MTKDKQNNLEYILNGLMQRYKQRVPDVACVLQALFKNDIIPNENAVQNDHIAFRTLGVQHLGIACMEKIFLHYGYEKKDALFFDEKKLNAFWYHPPQPQYPRIFLSELRVHDLSINTQNIIKKYVQQITQDPIDKFNLDDAKAVDNFLHSSLWSLPSLEDYKTLLAESEYAAWVIYNRYYLNHFTISVHDLQKYNNLETFNPWVESFGIRLNNSGGKIKKSPDGLLLQSATIAQMINAKFLNDESMLIAGSYVEFAERKVLPQFANMPLHEIKREHRRDGFEAKNADKIFESTFTSQTQKP